MTEKIHQAIEKIDNEAEKSGNTYYKIIASHIIDNYLKTDENAEKVLNDKKTLKKCMENIKSKAKNQAEGQMAMIEDTVVFGWVRSYYGFKEASSSSAKIVDILDFM